MLVHLLARTQKGMSHIPLDGLKSLGDALVSDDCSVTTDVRATNKDFDASVRLCEKPLQRAGRPDIIHTFGCVAAAAAVRWRPEGTKIVATFDESPEDRNLELSLAKQVDAVVPVSEDEFLYWRQQSVQVLSFGGITTLPIVPVPDDDGTIHKQRYVSTTCCGGTLDALVEQLPTWGGHHLMVVGKPSKDRWLSVKEHAKDLGVDKLLHLHTAEHAPSRIWHQTVVFVAGREVSRHGAAVIRAATYGVPCVAWAGGAHLDVIQHGLTGQLIYSGKNPRGVAAAVKPLLNDLMLLKILGEGAQANARLLYNPQYGGNRLRELYKGFLIPAGTMETVPDPLPAYRHDLVTENLSYARQLARKYLGRGQSLEDLTQVAYLGLVSAAKRFDPERGADFYAFVTPTILGELRKHFRDHSWGVRVPRTLQEASIKVRRIEEDRVAAGLPVAAADIAAALNMTEEEVRQAQQVNEEVLTVHSLDTPMGEQGDLMVAEIMGELDPRFDVVEAMSDIRAALWELPQQDRDIVLLYYYGDRTQQEIGEILGISQVKVSRSLSSTLAALRSHILFDEPFKVVR
jgi:RNA polymerase sigma-B factor